MQAELDANYPLLDIQILGVNAEGYESGNASFTANADIPWLQDVDANGNSQSDVWEAWGVTYRDVVILDEENIPSAVFNVTTNDLGVPVNYDFLRQVSISTAIGGDFDLNGQVDGADFLTWQRGETSLPFHSYDLSHWLDDYGSGSPLAATSAIPEPTTATLTLAALFLAISRRRYF